MSMQHRISFWCFVVQFSYLFILFEQRRHNRENFSFKGWQFELTPKWAFPQVPCASALSKDPKDTRSYIAPMLDWNRKRPASHSAFLKMIPWIEGRRRYHHLSRFQRKISTLYKTEHEQVEAKRLLGDANELSWEISTAPKTNLESTLSVQPGF